MPTTKKRYSVSNPPKPVKKNGKIIPADSTQMLLWFPNASIHGVNNFMTEENRRRNLVGRDNKVHTYKAIPMLVDHGLAHVNHEVYVPADKLEEWKRDSPEFNRLLKDAKETMKNLKKWMDGNVL